MENIIEKNKVYNIPNNKVIEKLIRNFLNNKKVNTLSVVHNDDFIQSYVYRNIETCTDRNLKIVSVNEISDLENTIRDSLMLSIVKKKYFYEGEVTEMKEVNEFIVITLMTKKESKVVQLPKYLKNLLDGIRVGDIIYIEPSIGIVKRIGRSEKYINEYDLEAKRYISNKKGQVFNSKDTDYTLSLYDLDFYFNRNDFNITSYTREFTNEFVENNNFIIGYTLIIIKDAHLLDECGLNIIKEYSETYESFKFILIGYMSELLFRNGMCVKLNEEMSNIDKLKILSNKANDDDFVNPIKEILNDNNLKTISTMMNISDSASEFIENLKLIK
ncbi:RUVB1 [Hepatospora eriocheir]|uniref:RuvB-like helicase n=1 Tax=Hepatospora eriocheir TaxID=1081669 RepID=A0A1X0Q7E0_9MICR|nr:RUVB1 [Hepatospora eriocheir]